MEQITAFLQSFQEKNPKTAKFTGCHRNITEPADKKQAKGASFINPLLEIPLLMSEDTLTGRLNGVALYTFATLAEKPQAEPEVDLFEKPRQAYKLSRLLADPEFEKQVYELMEQIPTMPGTTQTLYHILNKKMEEVVTAPIATVQQAHRIRRGRW